MLILSQALRFSSFSKLAPASEAPPIEDRKVASATLKSKVNFLEEIEGRRLIII